MSGSLTWREWSRRLSADARRDVERLEGRSAAVSVRQGWIVVWTNDDNPRPRVSQFPDLESLRTFLIGLPPDSVAVPVLGVPLRITRPPVGSDRRYLLLPDDKPIPLFDDLGMLEIADDFSLGPSEPELPLAAVGRRRSARSEDEAAETPVDEGEDLLQIEEEEAEGVADDFDDLDGDDT